MSLLQPVGVAVLLLGFALVLAGAFLYCRPRAFIAGARRITGEVVALEATGANPFVSSGSDDDLPFREEENVQSGETFAPRTRFVAPSGESVTVRGAASSPPRFTRGDRIALLVPTHDPGRAIPDRFLDTWLLVSMALGLGILLRAIGVAFLLLG